MPVRTRRSSIQFLAGLCVLTAVACSDQATAPEAPPPDDTPPVSPPEGGPDRTLSTVSSEEVTAATEFGGYVYVAGGTAGALDGPSRGSYDVFVRKYHPEGEMLWGSQFGSSGTDYPTAVAADRGGNLYVVGYTAGSLAGSRGSYDGFIRKFSPGGVPLWTRQFGSPAYDIAAGVAVDSLGFVYVAGSTFGTFDDGEVFGSLDMFVRRYNSAGTLVWHRQWGTSALDETTDLAADAAGNTYLVGRSYGGVYGQDDAVIRSYTAAGALRWIRWAGTSTYDSFTAVALDRNSNPIVVGTTGGSIVGFNAGFTDTFVRRYSSAGATLFTTQFGTGGSDVGNSVAVDASGNFVVGGYTDGSLAGSAGSWDAFARKYSSGNSILWTRQVGTPTTDVAYTVAGRGGAAVYLAGYTYGGFVGNNLGSSDGYLMKLGSNGVPIWTDQ